MGQTRDFDVTRLGLRAGGQWRGERPVSVPDLVVGGAPYAVTPDPVPVEVTVDEMNQGRALRIRFDATVEGPCQRCVEPASVTVEVDSRAVTGVGRTTATLDDDPELEMPWATDGEVDVAGWATEELVLALPDHVLCRDDCAGLCAGCGENLNTGVCRCGPAAPDGRWEALRGLLEPADRDT